MNIDDAWTYRRSEIDRRQEWHATRTDWRKVIWLALAVVGCLGFWWWAISFLMGR